MNKASLHASITVYAFLFIAAVVIFGLLSAGEGEVDRMCTSNSNTETSGTFTMREPKSLGCRECNAIGLWHCSDPIRCGGMKYAWGEDEEGETEEERRGNDNDTNNDL